MTIDWKYAAKATVLAIGTGIVAGFIADRIFARLDGKWEDVENWDEMYLPDVGEDDWDIPEGVNEVPRGKPSFEMEKPSLEEMVDYTKFYSHGSKKEKDDESDDEGVGAIHVISEEEFVKRTGNLDGYASVTGTWFAEDGILAGWDESLEIKDVDTTVGRTAISAFDHPDVDAVYVRNDVLNVLYEIVRGEGSYEGAAAELSYSPAPPEE